MKNGDIVTTQSQIFLGVIIDSKTLISTHGLSTEQAQLRGKNLNSHYVYWSSPKVEKNPVWVKERDLVKAV